MNTVMSFSLVSSDQPNNGLSKDKLSGVDKLEAMMKWQQEIINRYECTKSIH